MIPILFNSDAKDFSTRGLGPLADAVSCKVVEERNSTYELVMQYPKDGIHFEDIGLNKIILAIPSPYREAQPFRIYKISTPMRGVVTINAQHISYDLSGVAVMPFTGNSVADVLSKIKINSVNTNEFEFAGNSTATSNCVYSVPYTARQILGGVEGSIIDRFHGEYEFDKFTVRWMQNRGTDNGVTVRYGKNLLTLNQDVDVSKIVTGVIPYWTNPESGDSVVGDRVDMEGEYSFTKIKPLDLSQEFEEQPTKEQLNSRAKTYINANYSLEPEINCTVSFALIEQYEEYKDFKLLEKCDLCDIVTVQYPDLGVNSTAKIVKIETDVLKERYNSVTIGTVRANIAQTIVAQQKATENLPSRFDVSQLLRNSLDKVTGAQGGTVRFLDTNGDGEPDTLYIADNPNPADARKVWRFNYLGWAASSNGYNGPFTLGATLEDGLLADFVTAANLTAGTIKSADNGETFFLDLLNGVLRMKASSFSIEGKTVDDIAGEAADSALSEANDYTDKSASNTLDSANKYADSAASEAVNDFVNAVYDPKIESLQNQIDGQIESYFYDEAPTLSNEPAVNWETETEKQKHEGDLYFNKSTGYAYRFFNENGTWKWQQVRDTDITKALQDAAHAQDTADKKRRVFVSTPYTPYDVGDLWVQGSTGDIMKCKSARQSGTYDPGDWDKASKYTDDTAANAAEAHATRNTTAIEATNKEITLRATKEELDGTLGSVRIEYYLSDSSTSTVGGEWSTEAPAWVDGKYMWQRTTTVKYDGTVLHSDATCIAGATGASGTSVYTHIRYSANANGSGFVENPSPTTKYIGIYTGPSQTAPVSNAAYVWSKYMGDNGTNGTNGTNGKDGNGIRSITYYYKATANQTAPEASTITGTSIPTLSESNKYLWQKEVIDFTASDVADKTTVILLAVYGDKGKDGTSITITSTSVKYTASNSGTQTPTSGWGTSVPSVNNGQYLWTQTIVNYSDGTSTTAYSVAYKGTNGVSSYTHIKYSASSTGANFVDEPNANTKYMGVYTGTSQNAPSTASSYHWSKYVGDNGTNGTNGKDGNGIRSITYYYKATSTQTAPDASTVTATSIPVMSESNKYLWQKEVIDFTDSSVADKTTVILLAVYGDKGKDGTNGTSVSITGTYIEYKADANGTTAPSSGWSKTIPSVANGQYLWTKTVVNYSDGKSTTAYAVAYKGTNGATGVGISKVTPQYYLSTSNTTQVGGSIETTPPKWQANRYLWIRSKIDYDNGTTNYSAWVLDNTYNDLAQRVSQAEATLTVQGGEIQARATKEEFNALGTRVSTAESTIKTQGDQIQLKVTEDDVNSLIDQKADSIRLKADKISWESENSSMSEDGTLTCKNAKITGAFNTRTDSSIYNTVGVAFGEYFDLLVIYLEVHGYEDEATKTYWTCFASNGIFIGEYGGNSQDFLDELKGRSNYVYLNYERSIEWPYGKNKNLDIDFRNGEISLYCNKFTMVDIIGSGYQYKGYTGTFWDANGKSINVKNGIIWG